MCIICIVLYDSRNVQRAREQDVGYWSNLDVQNCNIKHLVLKFKFKFVYINVHVKKLLYHTKVGIRSAYILYSLESLVGLY